LATPACPVEEGNIRTYRFAAVLTKTSDEEGEVWGGYCPDGPGAFGAGANYDEAKKSLFQGIDIYVDYALECGAPIKEAQELPSLVDVRKQDPEAFTVEWVSVHKALS
jgi:predicted RNase H-like HicB family nuclease